MINITQEQIMQNWQVKNADKPLLSIRCTAYNHENFIAQALEGFLMQKTNFPFEIVVHDDASSDNTANIIREYEKKYPLIIKAIYETENQYSKHDGSLARIMNEATKGKYIAFCEGDDYWIDENKLQMQVDFLEANSEYSYTCHRYKTFDSTNESFELSPNKYLDKQDTIIENKNFYGGGFTFDYNYTVNVQWISQTLTAVFRKDALSLEQIKNFKYSRDVHYVYSILSRGKGFCFGFVGAVYRVHGGGIYGGIGSTNQAYINYKVFSELYNKTKDKVFIPVLENQYKTAFYARIQEEKSWILPKNFIELVCFVDCFTYHYIKRPMKKLLKR